MRLPVVIFALATLSLVGCSGDDTERDGFVAYYLEEHWTEAQPPARREDLTVPEGAKVVRCGPPTTACPGVTELPSRAVYYALTGTPELNAADFVADSARATVAEAGGPVVHVRFTDEGRDRFRLLTRRIAQAGRRDGRFHHLALVVGDRLVSFPTIDYRLAPDGIDSDTVEITGLGGMTEAEELARALRGD